MPWVTAVLGGIMVFFAGMAAIVSSPFERTSRAWCRSDGIGLDPSLQNPYMVAHPPALYLGYVSFAVPFAFAMAALITRRTDARWLASVRRWTLFAWASLGVGMLLGAHWAYVEIGWGGYWALGSGRERRADAVAGGHRLPALGDGAGEEGAC